MLSVPKKKSIRSAENNNGVATTQRENTPTIEELDRALMQPISKEGLAVGASELKNEKRKKSVIIIANEKSAGKGTLIYEVSVPQSWFGLSTNQASAPNKGDVKKYDFNVAKSMQSGTRKNEEEEAHKELKLGSLDVWALGRMTNPTTLTITIILI